MNLLKQSLGTMDNMLNKNLNKIEKENTFLRMTMLVEEFRKANPKVKLISLGIGDVSFPVAGPVACAMKKACDDLTSMKNFHGYGAYYGIEELRKTIASKEYKGLDISFDEIYVGDGTKTDSTSILEIFDAKAKILVGNPMYPIYQNGAYALGRKVYYAKCDKEFKMIVPKEHFDIIYICSPCNPVGNAYTRKELLEWIKYANKEGAYIIYDNVYHDFKESSDVPSSIYELKGSKTCAIELRSYSKSISFSGTRCSFMVLPKQLGEEIRTLWRERTINRFNGASYISQMGALASYKKEVQKIVKENISVYKKNAKYLKDNLIDLGFKVYGGTDSPYLWCETKDHIECWDVFDLFLKKYGIVVVPGLIFGSKGKYCIRISALGTEENTKKAIERIRNEKNI